MKPHSKVGLITNSSTTIYYSRHYIPLIVCLIIEYNGYFYSHSSKSKRFRAPFTYCLKKNFGLWRYIGDNIFTPSNISLELHSNQGVRFNVVSDMYNGATKANWQFSMGDGQWAEGYYRKSKKPLFNLVHPIEKGVPLAISDSLIEGLKKSRNKFKRGKLSINNCFFAYVQLNHGFLKHNGEGGYRRYLYESVPLFNHTSFYNMYHSIFGSLPRTYAGVKVSMDITRNAEPEIGEHLFAGYIESLDAGDMNSEAT